MIQTELELFPHPTKELQEILFEAVRDDDDWREKYACNTIHCYVNGTTEEKRKIDYIFAQLCGWSFETLVCAYQRSIDPAEAAGQYNKGIIL